MMNKTKKLLNIISAGLLIVIFMASCTNLPTRVIPELTPGQTGPAEDNTDVKEPSSGTDDELIQKPAAEVWAEPEAGPTVTPIVLAVEKKGEFAPVINPDEPVYSDESSVYYEAEYATPVPTAVAGGLMDEMQVVGFAPVSSAVVLPNQALHMDVTLKNSGTTTWQTTYKVVDTTANPMTVLREYYLPYAVAPGGTVVVSIYMSSPAELGTYQENFSIQDAYGAVFGTFAYTLIVGGFSSITEIPTLTATVTPTYYSAEGITATPDSLAWMCIDPERSKLQDCYQFCVEYSDREEFSYCFYDGIRYTTPIS